MWCYITDVTNKITDGTHNSPINTPKGDFKYITAKNIKAHGIELNNISYVSKNIHNEIYARCNPEKGDILYIKDGATTGVVTLNNLDEQFSLLSSVALIKPNKYISNKYLLYYLQSPLCYDSVRGSMKGVGITRITLKQIEKWELPLPPLSEQERIVCQIENWLSLIDTIEKGKENISIALKQAKSKILDLAIHGKLVPQDPNDEPASELLKRINPKAEITCDTPQYGKLPKGWCETHIGDAFKVTMGQSPDGSSLNPIDGMEFHQGKILFGNKYLRKSSVLTNSPTKIADADTLLLCVRAPVGVVNITKQRICIGRGLCCLTPTKAINLDYAFYMLTTFQEKFESQSTGSTFKAISGSIIKNEQLWLPPLSEQHRIVAKIEELFAHLDKIEASL